MPTSRTSDSHPIDVHFVPDTGLPSKGSVGFTLAPGRKGPGRAGMHDRDLERDVDRLRAHHRVDVVVSLVPDEEAARRTGVTSNVERRAVERSGMVFHHVPAVAGGLPDEAALVRLVRRLRDDVTIGRRVVVHDRAGGGRSAAVIAALLVSVGHSVGDAVAKVRAVRPKAIEASQERMLVGLASRLVVGTSPLLASVEAALKATGGTYQRIAGLCAIEAFATVDGVLVPFAVTTMEDSGWVVVDVPTLLYVPEPARSAVGELLHRLNWSLGTGGFVMDLEDGEVRFRSAQNVGGGTLTPAMLRSHVDVAVPAVAKHRDVIGLVASVGATP